MGVSPIACGAPAGKEKPFILDMAPSVAARGKIYKAKRRGEQIPLDWALDSEGQPTDDPSRALDGVMLPMGGPKGSGLSISESSHQFPHVNLLTRHHSDGCVLGRAFWLCLCRPCH